MSGSENNILRSWWNGGIIDEDRARNGETSGVGPYFPACHVHGRLQIGPQDYGLGRTSSIFRRFGRNAHLAKIGRKILGREPFGDIARDDSSGGICVRKIQNHRFGGGGGNYLPPIYFRKNVRAGHENDDYNDDDGQQNYLLHLSLYYNIQHLAGNVNEFFGFGPGQSFFYLIAFEGGVFHFCFACLRVYIYDVADFAVHLKDE